MTPSKSKITAAGRTTDRFYPRRTRTRRVRRTRNQTQRRRVTEKIFFVKKPKLCVSAPLREVRVLRTPPSPLFSVYSARKAIIGSTPVAGGRGDAECDSTP